MLESFNITNAIDNQWAAWAQAILSAIAIFASVLMVNRQHRLELNRIASVELERKHQYLKSAFQLVGAVYMITGKIDKWAQAGGNPAHARHDLLKMKTELDGLIEALRQTDYGRFDEHTPIEAILFALCTARIMVIHLSNVYGGPPQLSPADIGAIGRMSNDLGPPLKERLNKLHAMLHASSSPA